MLLSLGDKSLVTSEHERTRYRLLETVRQYLREKLLHTEEAAAIRDRHLSLFADFAERQAKDDFGRGMPTAFRNLDSEQDNLRRALVWSLESPRHLDAGLRLCVALSHYWVARGLVAEGLDWTAKLVERCENSPAPPRLHVLAMLIAGSYLIHQRGPVAARPTIERAFNLAVKLGDPMVLGAAHHHVANLALADNRFDAAEAAYREAVRIRRETGPSSQLIATLNNLGTVLNLLERNDEARAVLEECVRLSVEIDDIRLLAAAMANLAGMDASIGNWDTVMPRLESALEVYRGIDDKWGTASLLTAIGSMLRLVGRTGEAEPLLEEAVALNRESRSTGMLASNLNNLAAIARQRGQLDRARLLTVEGLRMRLARGDDGETLLSLEEAAFLLAAEGSPGPAVTILAACDAARKALRVPFTTLEAREHDAEVDAVRRMLSDESFEQIWAQGASLSLPDAARLVLGDKL